MSGGITRRVFLARTGVLAVGLAGSSSPLLRAAAASQSPDSVLVFILLRGGVDGLSICAPYGDPEYYKARPNIALPKPGTAGSGSLLDLDGYFGLHPACAALEPIWRDGRLAVLHAVGSYAMSRSHFDAQEFLETGTPGVRGTTSGWMDRCVSAVPGASMMQGVAFAPVEPRAFLGFEPVLVTQDISRFELDAEGWKHEAEGILRDLYGADGSEVFRAGQQAFSTLDLLRGAPALHSLPSNGARYPVTQFGTSLRQAAQIIKADIGTRCIFIGHESAFDTHSNQLANNAADFPNVGLSLGAFYRDLGKRIDDVVVIVASEFGRTVAEDGSLGTDHGTGGTMLLIGGGVRGGRVAGRWPGIARNERFEERDLAVTTDFRDVLIEVMEKHLRVPGAASLFPNHVSAKADVLS